MPEVGRAATRVEDRRFLTGKGLFVDDVDRPGQLHLRVVRSSLAHGAIRSLDTEQASRMPGVVAVVTADQLGSLPPIPVRISPDAERLTPYLQPVLARDRVRYVGEPIAAVVAEDPYRAEDAAELVAVDIEELPVNLVAGPASEGGGPALFPGHANEVAELVASFGDSAAAFAEATHVVSVGVDIARQTAAPIETRGLVAEWDPSGTLHIWGATKVPHFNRRIVAAMLGVDTSTIWMHRSDAGGGFGVRGELYPEDVLVPLVARTLARPVKWVEDRAEHLMTANHSRAQRHRVSGAFGRDGCLLALRDEIFHDNGAYMRTHGLTVPELTITMLPGPYRMKAYEARVHVYITNKTPCGTYRSPGRYESNLARERLLDVAAERLAIDRVELRRRNLLKPTELPCDRGLRALGTDVVLDEGDYPGLLDSTLEAAGFDSWNEEAVAARAGGRLVGVGVAPFLEKSGLGPYESGSVTLQPSGRLRVASGGTSLGQGIETVMAQITADAFGVTSDAVEVVTGDTAELENGLGSWASRSSVVGGSAVHMAATEVAEAARRAAGDLFEAAAEDVRLVDGKAFVAGSPERSLALGEVVRAAGRAQEPEAEDRGLSATCVFDVAHMTYPYGVHLAQVEVDRETGSVRVLRYFVGYEIGRAINPASVEGQIIGGAIQGIGGALLEELAYTADGQPISASLIDYQLPFASEAVDVGTLVTERFPSSSNPLGVKGSGEAGIAASGAAIACAVGDALGSSPVSLTVPLTPDRVLGMLRASGAAPREVEIR